MVAEQLIWLNTKDAIIDAMVDPVLSMEEAGFFSKEYIKAYVDVYIDHRCNIAFIDYNEEEEKHARINMFNEIHVLLGLD